MGGIDQNVIRELQELVVETVVEHAGEFGRCMGFG